VPADPLRPSVDAPVLVAHLGRLTVTSDLATAADSTPTAAPAGTSNPGAGAAIALAKVSGEDKFWRLPPSSFHVVLLPAATVCLFVVTAYLCLKKGLVALLVGFWAVPPLLLPGSLWA